MTPLPILLATYDGARFLPAQLDSLAAQRDAPPWQLLWRDDGSSDATVALLQAFPGARRLQDEAGRQGPGGSFMRLLAAAPDDAPAFSFCDQDDVWLPDKLARAWAWIAAQDPARPALYCARQQLVDAALTPIGLSPAFRRAPGLRNALVENIAVGCTVMLNAAARRLVLAAPPMPAASMHDWWCHLLVAGAGGAIMADSEPALLYRQHGGNSVGAAVSVFGRARGALQRGAARFATTLAAHLDALAAAAPLLTEENRALVARLRVLPHLPRPARLALLARSGLQRQRLADQVFLYALIGAAPRI
ncbi:glycosyltransferase [Roseomonas sp. 18066]|uniref:glycosyltransferase n=1 Tax=Roseomonas sp. 18066 TaxID=2681412 RepID=UPI00135C4B48|nr:glycosyltransferase [Roseomonas sp. 18066]